MARKQKKPKAGHQKSKRRKARGPRGESDTAGAGGTMSGLRGGFKKVVGTGGAGKTKKASPISRVIDIALWIAVGAAVIYFISNAQCST